MLKDTVEKVKFKVLVRRLAKFGETERSVIGLLELLWRHTAIDAPCGDIGRFSDEEIAAVLQFDGNPSELVEALVSSGWVDVCEQHRLVVHDWFEHAPRWVIAKLSKLNKKFIEPVNRTCPVANTERSTERSTVRTVEGTNESSVRSTVRTTERSPLLSSPFLSSPSSKYRSNEPAALGDDEASVFDPADANERESEGVVEDFDRGRASTPESYPKDFLAFYDAYPRKQGKRKAAQEFARAKRRKPPPEIIQAAKEFAAATVWQDPKYLPLPATWLHQDRFDDDRTEWLEPAARDAQRLKEKLDSWYGGDT